MGAESLSPVGLGIDAGINLFKIFYGLGQTISGNKKLNDLEKNRPVYNADPNILYNQQLAGKMASEGIPASAKNWYTDSIERGLGSTIQAAKDTGQGLNSSFLQAFLRQLSSLSILAFPSKIPFQIPNSNGSLNLY